jgi:hypothetical protein
MKGEGEVTVVLLLEGKLFSSPDEFSSFSLACLLITVIKKIYLQCIVVFL